MSVEKEVWLMIFTYDVLKDVISTGKPIIINEQSQIQKLMADKIAAIKFVSKIKNEHEYYCFLELNPGKGIVFSSDGNTFDGFSVFQIPLSEFYFDVDVDKGVIGIEDGVGNETDFLDLFTGPSIGEFSRKYHHASDEEIMHGTTYEMTDRYLGDYLGFEGEDAQKLNLTLLRFLMAVYFDQNPASKPVK